jgi:hypothetical protein
MSIQFLAQLRSLSQVVDLVLKTEMYRSKVMDAVYTKIDSGDFDSAYRSVVSQIPATLTESRFPKRLLPVRGTPGVQTYDTRISATYNFPVAAMKYALLRRHYPISAFLPGAYDVDIVRSIGSMLNNKLMRRFMKENIQTLLTIDVHGREGYEHAVAGILTPNGTLFIINTTPTPPLQIDSIVKMLRLNTGRRDITGVDVITGTGINLQEDEDEVFCVTWMLNALLENGGVRNITLEVLQDYLRRMKQQQNAMGGNTFIINRLNQFKQMYSFGGKRRKPNKWIQEVVGHMKEGAFTQQALKAHMTPEKFADEVKKHPKHYALKTRRRAQFLRNIRKRTIKSSNKK